MSLEELTQAGFDVHETNHAEAILSRDFREEFTDLCATLLAVRIRCTEMLQGGGNEAPPTRRLRRSLAAAGWGKRNIVVRKTVDGVALSSRSHEIDHVHHSERGTLDLENFQRLHADGAISVGIVVTRGQSLQTAIRDTLTACAKVNNLHGVADFARLSIKEPTANQRSRLQRLAQDMDFATATATMMATKYGESTTHWKKLTERLERGVGNPCPLLLIGLPASCVDIVEER